MTGNELAACFGLLQTAYPDKFKGVSDEAQKTTMRLWFENFKNEPAGLFTAVIQKHISTSADHFFPDIGTIAEELRQAKEPQEPTFAQEWESVKIAMCNSTYNSQEEFKKLSPTMRKAIGSASRLREFAMMGESDLQYARHDLEQAFTEAQRREHEAAKTPQSVWAVLESYTPVKELGTPSIMNNPIVSTGNASQPDKKPEADKPDSRKHIEQCKEVVRESMRTPCPSRSGFITQEQKAAALEKLRGYKQ